MVITGVTKQLTLHRQFLPTWERRSGDLAIVDGEDRITWGEHRDRVFRIASAMQSSLGLSRTSRFAVLALNGREYLELYHAAHLGAGVINALNIRLAGPEIAFILNDSGTEVVFVDKMFAPLVEAIRADLDTVRTVVLIGDGDVAHDLRYDDLIASGEAVEPVEGDESDMVGLMYTGGTTGLPKGVVHTQRSYSLTVLSVVQSIPLRDDSRWLSATPLFHAASLGSILEAPYVGLPQVLIPMYEPGAVLTAIEDHQLTDGILVPVMIQMLLDHPEFSLERFASMRTLYYGGSPMPAAVLQRAQDLAPDLELCQLYGMTEGLPLTMLSPQTHRDGGPPLRSAGKPVAGARITVQGEDGAILDTEQVGEVCARAGFYMEGYWNRPEETAAAFRGEWYHTGDMGYFDKDGFLYLVDRAKDMIVTGGENVYSSEVESAVSTHPEVAQVAVIGIPSEQWGETVHAVVVPRPGTEPTAESIIAHTRGLIAAYKTPTSIEFRAEPLPLTGAGKVLKRALRDPYWEGYDRRVN